MTVADYIATELSGPPIIAGFDVDDTTMFTSPGFWWGKIELGDRATRLPSTLSDPQERAAAERFWRRMNTELDRYSTVKDSARALIAAHRARGDAIIFITGRPDIRDGRDGLAEKIASEMGLERPEIHYVGQLDKVAVLRQARVAVYYGDARADMESAAAAGARPVAIIRSRLSGNNNAQAREGPYQVLLTDSEN
jgi:acid phosphatase (class B)